MQWSTSMRTRKSIHCLLMLSEIKLIILTKQNQTKANLPHLCYSSSILSFLCCLKDFSFINHRSNGNLLQSFSHIHAICIFMTKMLNVDYKALNGLSSFVTLFLVFCSKVTCLSNLQIFMRVNSSMENFFLYSSFPHNGLVTVSSKEDEHLAELSYQIQLFCYVLLKVSSYFLHNKYLSFICMFC